MTDIIAWALFVCVGFMLSAVAGAGVWAVLGLLGITWHWALVGACGAVFGFGVLIWLLK